MRNIVSGILLAIGVLGLPAIWLLTTHIYCATGQTMLAMVSLLIPSADLVLPFLIPPKLGFAGLGSTLVAFAGSALQPD